MIKVNGDRTIAIPLLMFVGLLGGTITATMGWAAVRTEAAEAKAMSVENAARISALEKGFVAVALIQKDVEWIKETMQEERRRSERNPGTSSATNQTTRP